MGLEPTCSISARGGSEHSSRNRCLVSPGTAYVWTSPGRPRRRIAVEEFADLDAVEAKIKKGTAELKTMVTVRDSRLMDIHGVGPVVAARVLAHVGGITGLLIGTGSHPATRPPVSRTATADRGPRTGG